MPDTFLIMPRPCASASRRDGQSLSVRAVVIAFFLFGGGACGQKAQPVGDDVAVDADAGALDGAPDDAVVVIQDAALDDRGPVDVMGTVDVTAAADVTGAIDASRRDVSIGDSVALADTGAPAGRDAGSADDSGGGCGNGTCDLDETCESCARDCGSCPPLAPEFDDAPLPSTFRTDLSCNVPGIQAIESRVQVGLQGSEVASVLGVDDAFAGIGARFELRNNQYPAEGVNVLEPRSGAGAGWQTSFLVTDWDGGAGIIVFNQAAGNAVGYQWGYRATIVAGAKNIYATSWSPLDSDHIHAAAGGHSPCEPSGYVFDDGAVDIAGSLVSTAHGTAMAWRNRFRVRSRGEQQWPAWSAEQAFYLNRSVARTHGLRLYLVRGSTQHGPLAIYDAFSIPQASCTNSFCNTGAYDYAVLIWTIAGLDIGVALPGLSATSVNLEQQTYCADARDDSCGNINFHSWLASGGPVHFAAGQVRTLEQVYYVGTLAQLADLGFVIR